MTGCTSAQFLQKDSSYVPSQRFLIRFFSKPLRQEIHIAYDILCCKSHLQMNLKKGKHFTPKEENSFLMSCFSFQTWKDLVLVKFCYIATVQRFLKTFRKFALERLWWKPFLGKFKLFKMDSVKGFFTSFPNTFLWLLPNIEQKCTTLTDNIVWFKYSRVIKDLSKSENLSIINPPNYLGARLIYSLYAQALRIFWNVFVFEKKKRKKNPWNLKGLIAKITPH